MTGEGFHEEQQLSSADLRQSARWEGEHTFQRREIVRAQAPKWERASVFRASKEADMADVPNLSSCHSPRQEPWTPELAEAGQLCRHGSL